MAFEDTVGLVVRGIEAAGVAVTVGGMTAATVVLGRDVARGAEEVYRGCRRHLGRSILFGLEFIIAADIIRTIAVTPTFGAVGVLAVIVLVRTFLSMTLELELEGEWPWRRARGTGANACQTRD